MSAALERLDDGQGSTFLIEGPAGIGKTRLLAESAGLAAGLDLTVLRARAGQLERDMPFVVARELLVPLIDRTGEDERARLLSGAAAHALAALGRPDPGDGSVEIDLFTSINSLYWLLANLADARSVLLLVDDLQWADVPSLRWLDYVARRGADTGTMTLGAVRTGEADEPEELEALRLDAAGIIRPAPLSDSAVSDLTSDALDSPSHGLSQACWRATGGNPFLLTELLRELRERDSSAADLEAPDLELIGTESLARSVNLRLKPFGASAVALSRTIAVLGGAPQLRHAAELTGLTEEDARGLCDRLREAEILAPGQPIDFVHPLVRATVYREMSDEELAAAHRRAAEVLSKGGSPPRDIAPHLMATPPNGDPWVVEQLREAGHEAMGSGAPAAARRYIERALAEPAEDPAPITYELGRALWGTSPAEAPEVLVSAAEECDEPEARAQASEDAAWAYFDCGNLERAVHWLDRLAGSLPDELSEERLHTEGSLYALRVMQRGRRPEDRAPAEEILERITSDSPGARTFRQAVSFDRCLGCEPVDAVLDLASSFPPAPWAGGGAVPGLACKVLAWSGAWDLVREESERGWAGARSVGLVHVASYRESFLAEIDRLAGRLIDSEAAARTGWDILREDAPMSLPGLIAISNLVSTLIARGKLDEAAELAGEWDFSAPFSVIPLSPILLEVRGTLRLAQGELEGGVADLLEVGEDLERFGFLNPAAVPWRQEVVPALATLGRTNEARAIVGEGEERARRFGAPHIIGSMLRARAAIEPKDEAVETLRESIGILTASGPPHELAASALSLGARLRRDGQRVESRGPLRHALELATVSGADGLAEHARNELAAAGSRPRSAFRTGVNSLTASELRVAHMAADGLGNVEIAQRLFVTRKTVEKHLSNAYTKLEIAGRDELTDALSGQTVAQARFG